MGPVRLSLATWLTFCTLLGAEAASFDQRDDFQDGTTMAWGGNKLGTVTNIPGGGPAGANDAFLRVDVSGFHLGTKNTSQWAGDFSRAGIDAIEMDLNHLDPGTYRLDMRILLFGPGGTFASRDLTPPLPTNTWTHVVFPLSADALVYVTGGTGVLADTLSDVTTLLLRHDRMTPTPPGHHPPHIIATLGIDNVHAVPRKPVVGNLSLDPAQASFDLEQLVVGETYRVETTGDLRQGAWANISSFQAASESTNLTAALEGDRGVVRATMP